MEDTFITSEDYALAKESSETMTAEEFSEFIFKYSWANRGFLKYLREVGRTSTSIKKS
jgi:hypothetical protein